MRSYYVPIGELYLEVRVGQCLKHGSFKLNYVILWQNNPSCPIFYRLSYKSFQIYCMVGLILSQPTHYQGITCLITHNNVSNFSSFAIK